MYLKTMMAGVWWLIVSGVAAPVTHAADVATDTDLAIIDVEQVLSGERLTPTTKLTRDFKTYTLFLFPSPRWLASAESRATVEQLRSAFLRFSRAAGNDNLAVWLRRDSRSDEPDSERAALLARALKLDANVGAWVVYIEPNSAEKLTLLINQTGSTKVLRMSFRMLQDALFSKGASNVLALNVAMISPNCAVDVLNQLQADLRLEQPAREEARRRANVCELVEGWESVKQRLGKIVGCTIGMVKQVGIGGSAEPRRGRVGIDFHVVTKDNTSCA